MSANTLTKPEQRISLVTIGDQSLAVPGSLLFSKDLSALDVRVWCALRMTYQAKQPLSMDSIAEQYCVDPWDVFDSKQMLTVHRWLVWPFQEQTRNGVPRICATQLTTEAVVRFNEDYWNDMEALSETASGRVIKAARQMLSSLS